MRDGPGHRGQESGPEKTSRREGAGCGGWLDLGDEAMGGV